MTTVWKWTALNAGVMSFYRINAPIAFNYYSNNVNLQKVETVSDLGVTFDRSLSFCIHIDNWVTKALTTLGFIKRTTIDFRNVGLIINRFNSLFLSILTYCSVVCSPQLKLSNINSWHTFHSKITLWCTLSVPIMGRFFINSV